MFYVAEMERLSNTTLGGEELFRSDNVLVRRVQAGSADRWVVTFDHYGIGHGFDRPGFAQTFLETEGISAIHVMGRAEDWYQYEDMFEALATVRAATQGAQRVLTYGSSMGGYAALRFADAVGATDALALSPQYSIDPKIATHEGRWSQDVRRIRWRPEMNGPIVCSARAVIVYDPTGLDRWHAERIAADAPVTEIRLPHTAHPVTTYLSETGLLKPLVGLILNGDFDARAFRREARRRRRNSGIYLGELAAAQPGIRTDTAMSLARKAVEETSGSFHARVALARLLTREARHDEAIALLSSVVDESDRGLTYVIDHANALAASGQVAAARRLSDEVLSRATDVAHLYAWAAHMSWQDRDVASARRFILRAVRLDPRNRTYLFQMADYNLGALHPDGAKGVRMTLFLRLGRRLISRTAPPALQT